MSDCYSPLIGGWLQRDVGTQVLPSTRAGVPGHLQAGNRCMSCWSGTGCCSSVLVSFALWVSMTRVMGNTASAAALDFLSEGGSAERDGERLSPWFSSGDFHRLCFCEPCLGHSWEPFLFPKAKAGVSRFPSHPRAEPGSGESLPCLQHTAWVLSISLPREWPSS